MGEASKKTKKTKKTASKQRDRQERRFLPRPVAKPLVVQAVGGLGSAALGAGTWAQFGHQWTDSTEPPYSFAPAVIAVGAVLFGVAVWLGTSGEAVLRVGSGGVGIEKAKEVVRVPWYGVERVTWDPDAQALSVVGADETGAAQRLTLKTSVHPAAIGWLVKEARARIPDAVDVPDETLGVPSANPADGEVLTMDAVQVVGRRCAASDRVIAYEPDARVCPRCERVYYKLAVPESCACGAWLQALRDGVEAEKAGEDAGKSSGASA